MLLRGFGFRACKSCSPDFPRGPSRSSWAWQRKDTLHLTSAVLRLVDRMSALLCCWKSDLFSFALNTRHPIRHVAPTPFPSSEEPQEPVPAAEGEFPDLDNCLQRLYSGVPNKQENPIRPVLFSSRLFKTSILIRGRERGESVGSGLCGQGANKPFVFLLQISPHEDLW